MIFGNEKFRTQRRSAPRFRIHLITLILSADVGRSFVVEAGDGVVAGEVVARQRVGVPSHEQRRLFDRALVGAAFLAVVPQREVFEERAELRAGHVRHGGRTEPGDVSETSDYRPAVGPRLRHRPDPPRPPGEAVDLAPDDVAGRQRLSVRGRPCRDGAGVDAHHERAEWGDRPGGGGEGRVNLADGALQRRRVAVRHDRVALEPDVRVAQTLAAAVVGTRRGDVP